VGMHNPFVGHPQTRTSRAASRPHGPALNMQQGGALYGAALGCLCTGFGRCPAAQGDEYPSAGRAWR
jgi:hypothetical protein